jgi:hypothetical protein
VEQFGLQVPGQYRIVPQLSDILPHDNKPTIEEPTTVTLEIDTSRAPRRPTELRALVHAVENATAEDEADWIEWKSALDLSAKAVRATLARHIIGMANRRIEEAHRFAEGFGFILVGVEPGNRCGVTRLDLADLDAGIAAYLGPHGPRWTVSYDTDPADGRSVLIVTVDPPKHGDPVHMLRREFEKYRDGDVFVRKVARTERHTAADLEYLIRRAVPRRPGLDLGVVIAPARPVLRPLVGLDAAVESWVAVQRERLLASVEKPPLGPPHPSRFAAFERWDSGRRPQDQIAELKTRAADGAVLTDLERAALMLAERIGGKTPNRIETWAEERTPQEYRSQVEMYLENCRSELMKLGCIAYLRELGAAFTVELGNRTERNLTDVELVLEFSIACEASGLGRIAGLKDALDAPKSTMPTLESLWSDPPEPFGPWTKAGVVRWPLKTRFIWDVPPRDLHYLHARRPVQAECLRPRGAKQTASYLVVTEDAGAEIFVRWSATATNADGRLDGQFAARVADEPIYAAELLGPTLAALPDTTRGAWGYATEVVDPRRRVRPRT